MWTPSLSLKINSKSEIPKALFKRDLLISKGEYYELFGRIF